MSQIQRVRRKPYPDTNPQNVACLHLDMLKMIKQVQGETRIGGSEEGTQNWFSKYQEFHTQLWRKQNISEFKSLYKGSTLILIEQHFMPTCSRITSTIHSAKIRRRWSANWVMWSYSICAKLHQKNNVLIVFFIGIKELCTALADNAWFTASPEDTFNRLRIDAISIPDNVIKKGATHGALHGKNEVQREYHLAWNTCKRCWKKVDSQGEHLTGIHDRFHRDPVYRESQLAIGWSGQKCKEWDELAKEDHTYKLTPEEKRRYKGDWYFTQNKAGKNGLMKHRSDYRAAVMMEKSLTPRIGRTNWRTHPCRSTDAYDKDKKFSPKIICPALELINILYGTIGFHLQVPRGGVRIRMELEVKLTVFFCSNLFLFQLVSFTVDSGPL